VQLNVPNLGIENKTCGIILNATTTKTSAFRFLTDSKNSGFRNFSGWKRLRLFSSAKTFTGEGVSFIPLPLALSGAVTTPTTL